MLTYSKLYELIVKYLLVGICLLLTSSQHIFLDEVNSINFRNKLQK